MTSPQGRMAMLARRMAKLVRRMTSLERLMTRRAWRMTRLAMRHTSPVCPCSRGDAVARPDVMGAPGEESIAALLVHAQSALSTTQEGVGKVLGVSRRTMTRWSTQGGMMVPSQAHDLARAVYPVDAVLAAKIAAFGGATLESLGLAKPPPPAAAPVAPPPPSPHLVDSVVCAAAEVLDVSPLAVRPALHAAFARAREVGLAMHDVEALLAPRTPRPAKTAKAKP